MKLKNFTVSTFLLFLVILVPQNYSQAIKKCLTFSDDILNRGEMTARPLKGRPVTTITTSHFMIHFVDRELHPNDPDAAYYGYANYVALTADQVWNKQVNQLGWPPPPSDGVLGGGIDKYDIYLRALSEGYGYTQFEDPVPGTNGYTSYVVVSTGISKYQGDPWRPMTEDEIKATVAHEFHHAIQDGLTWLAKDMNKNSWFYENTATWMEEICYPEVDDWIVTFINGPTLTTTSLKRPDLPIDHFGSTITNQYQYSGALFCHTMSKWKGNSIIKDIWMRAKNTTIDFVHDIDYVLNQNQTSLADVLNRYAVWRYYTGSNDDGNHFNKASLMEGLYILQEHNNGTGSGSSSPENLNSRGGTSYIEFKNADGVINLNFDGQNNTEFAAIALNKRIYFADVENNFTLDNFNDGTLNNQSCIGEDYVVLVPVVTDWQNLQSNISYTYNSTFGTGISTSFWTEKGNSNITQGTLSVQQSSPITSGHSRGLTNLFDYKEKTNFERFSNFQGKPVKHNNWNNISNNYFLANDFQASIQNDKQSAKYEFLDPVRIQVKLESILFPEKGSAFFLDPWYVLANGSQPGDHWINFTSEYEPTGKEGATEKGVFLNQLISSGTYYNIWAGDQQINLGSPIGARQFYLQNWTSTGADLQAFSHNHQKVVFTSPNATVQANLKGQGLSNSEEGYTSNSQRKFVRTNDGVMYNLYESLNRIWLEKSTDNGATWSIINNGNPLKNVDSRNPAMCLTYYNGLIIVFETEGLIWIYEYNPATNIAYERTSIYSCTISAYESNPVVTYCFNENASVTGPVVIWKSYGNDEFCGNAGLYYAMINADNWTVSPETIITNTDINSYDPSIAGNDPIYSEATWKGDPMKFNLVWEQRGSVNSSIMFYHVERLANKL